MPRTSLRRIHTFIEMYHKEDEIQVEKINGFVNSKYMVTHMLPDDQEGRVLQDRNEYLCRTLRDVSDCVNRIIFKLPMEDNVAPLDAAAAGKLDRYIRNRNDDINLL